MSETAATTGAATPPLEVLRTTLAATMDEVSKNTCRSAAVAHFSLVCLSFRYLVEPLHLECCDLNGLVRCAGFVFISASSV